MKLCTAFLREAFEERVEGAVKYGIRRAYKHFDDKPPSEAQETVIVESVLTELSGMIDWEDPQVEDGL